jgi:hypothetical protein
MLFDLSAEARLKRFARNIINTRYFFVAFLFHVMLLALFGAKVIFEKIEPKGLFVTTDTPIAPNSQGKSIQPLPDTAIPKPPDEKEVKQRIDGAAAPRVMERSATRIATNKVNPNFPIPDVVLPDAMQGISIQSVDGLEAKIAGQELDRLKGIAGFQRGGIRDGNGNPGIGGDGTKITANFTCYVGKYAGADWNCNFGFIADKRWYSNCIYNLMLQISRWTQGRVKATLKPEALELASKEWLEKVKPPFIFITGHEDFVLDEAEVENLQQYLMLGGALWVDSSLPGRRSRFDVALRREMKKVLPDRDFETLPGNHPLYKSYYEFTGPPAAMNFYKEPVEVIKVGAGGGDVAVIYTLNAYSDLWETGLTEKDKIDKTSEWSPERQGPVWRTGPHYGAIFGNWQSEIFYRNVNETSIVSSYKFGINIVFYLLNRYKDKLRALPI